MEGEGMAGIRIVGDIVLAEEKHTCQRRSSDVICRQQIDRKVTATVEIEGQNGEMTASLTLFVEDDTDLEAHVAAIRACVIEKARKLMACSRND